ncbi:hypothetical protein PVAND_000592 [Polypedilum vanderplanki]|uniref:Cuticular protein n=1 Tax=Polypedilum vanderplanki TaxID=319348 RepID=A0A9J6BKE9_POLVA|nr:hypothetical protein PVAND_000592 [Polypedilum vanderplanki]
MKAFVIATLFVASCSAYGAISTQYQAHDGLGGYSYGYSDPLSTKHESKAHDGSLHGGYSYVDAHGHVQSVKYVADPHHGFQVVHATNLPKGPAPVHAIASPVHYAVPSVHSHWGVPSYAPLAAPSKTPEVLAAEHAHFAAHAEAKARLHHHHKRSAYGYAPAIGHNGVPIDTPEVQHEKAQHFAAHQRALQGLPANPLIYTPQIAHAPAYHAPAYTNWHHNPAPAPVNGIPVDTVEVQHEKAKHFALVADAKAKLAHSGAHYAPAHYAPAPDAWNHAGHGYNGPLHYPVIGHNGVPEETPEVKAEKAKHFALVADAKAHQPHAGHYAGLQAHEDDGSYKPEYDNEHYWH